MPAKASSRCDMGLLRRSSTEPSPKVATIPPARRKNTESPKHSSTSRVGNSERSRVKSWPSRPKGPKCITSSDVVLEITAKPRPSRR
jgi:hypothetical protein